MATNTPQPDKVSPAWAEMQPRFDLMNALLSGTEGMRAAGRTYLPTHQQETETRYLERLRTNVLLNMTELTLNQLSSMPFREPVKPQEDIPPEIMNKVLDDVDLQGNNLDVFCRRWFREGFAKAFCHVLVEYPRARSKPDGSPRTLADDRAQNMRPYWVLVQPEDVIYAYSEIENGVEVLKHVRIMEEITEMGDWEEICEKQIRVLEPGHVRIYRQKGPKNKRIWYLYDEWDVSIDKIPLVTFYSNRISLCLGKPPLLDLAYMNVEHWQSSSDQRAVLTVARFPMLAASGYSETDSGKPIVVGPYQLLTSSSPEGKFYYVEHTGAAIDAGQKSLEALEESMSSYGGQFLQNRPGAETATARALDSSESTSDLLAITLTFEDAVAQVLQLTADWMGLPEGGTIELVKEFSIDQGDSISLDALDKARTRKDISRNRYLTELKRYGVLEEEFDIEKDAELLQEEASNALDAGLSLFNLDPTQQAGAPQQGNPPPPGGNPQDNSGG